MHRALPDGKVGDEALRGERQRHPRTARGQGETAQESQFGSAHGLALLDVRCSVGRVDPSITPW
jgi:hypothetical protein